MTAIQATLAHLRREYQHRHSTPDNVLWTMRNGDTIPVRDMTDRHLYNTISMIYRNSNRPFREETSAYQREYMEWLNEQD